MNPEVQTYVQQVVGENFAIFSDETLQQARRLFKNVSLLLARDAASKARDLVIRKSALESNDSARWLTVQNKIHKKPNYLRRR